MRKWIDVVSEASGGMSEDDLAYAVIGKLRDQYRSSADIDFTISGKTIQIDLISVLNSRQGIGTEIMKEICWNADDYGVTLELEAANHGRGEISQSKLERWYGRFGFVPTGERSSENHPYMRRSPKLAEHVANDNGKNQSLVVDVPMLQARGLKRLLDRCRDASLGEFAYREDHKPLRRRYVIRGDHRIIKLLRQHLGDRGIDAVLTEAWHTSMSNGQQTIDVMRNPSRKELAQLLRIDPVVRAWVTPTDLYAFPASQLTHADALRDLPECQYGRDARIFLDAQGPYLDQNTLMGDVMFWSPEEKAQNGSSLKAEIEVAQRWHDLLTDHPSLKRLYGTYQLGCR